MAGRLPQSRDNDAFRIRWKSRFEQFAAERNDDAGIAGWTTSGLETRFREFRRQWKGAGKSGVWLDVGCGAGTYTRFLNDTGLRIVGVDYSLPTLFKARARSGESLEWVVGDVTRLPLKPGTIDGVLCFGVLQAIAETGPAVMEIADVLKPGGVLWVDALNAKCLPNRIEILRRRMRKKPAHLHYETESSLRAALNQCGFDVVSLHYVIIMPARFRRLQFLADSAFGRRLLRLSSLVAGWMAHSVLIEASRRD